MGPTCFSRARSGAQPALLAYIPRVCPESGRPRTGARVRRPRWQDLHPHVFPAARMLPRPSEGSGTKGLWEKSFADWGQQAQAIAQDAASKFFGEQAGEFMGKPSAPNRAGTA